MKDFRCPLFTEAAIVLLVLMAAFVGAQAFQSQAEYYDGGNGVLLPDPRVTPGKADPRVTQQTIARTICQPNYTAKVRHVTQSTKLAVFKEYGIDPNTSAQFEVDHLVSLEIGGANDITNLWPQPYETDAKGAPAGAHIKDRLENALHRAVCRDEITLSEAQSCIAVNWYQCAKAHGIIE